MSIKKLQATGEINRTMNHRLSQHQRYQPTGSPAGLLSLSLVLALLLLATSSTSAQMKLDTVWKATYEIRMDKLNGERDAALDTFTMWFSGDRFIMDVPGVTAHLSYVGDTMFTLGDFEKTYTKGPANDPNVPWMIGNPAGIWKVRRHEPSQFHDGTATRKILSYSTRQNILGFTTEMEERVYAELFVTDEIDMDPVEIRRVYQAFGKLHQSLARSFIGLLDSIAQQNAFPMMLRLGDPNSKRPNVGITVIELIDLRRTSVPADFYFPNRSEYRQTEQFDPPTPAQVWQYLGVPMPGGPKE